MLTRKSLKSLKLLLKGGHLLRISVFDWDDSTGHVILTDSKVHWLCVILMVIYLSGQFLFEIVQLVRLAGDPSEPYPNYMKLLMQWLTRFAALIPQVDSLFYGRRKATLMNMTMVLNKRFQEVKGSSQVKDVMKSLARVVLVITYVNPAFTALDFVEGRTQSRYWHHLVIPPAVFPFTVPFIAVIEYFITASGLQHAIWYLWVVTSYIRTSKEWMKLVMNVDTVFGDTWKEDALAQFRTMQVHNQIYNDVYWQLWTLKVAFFFVIETMAIVLSLKLAPSMPFPTNLMFPTAAVMTTWYTVTVYKVTTAASDYSEELAHRWKISGDTYRRAVGGSMKPLRVEVRPFFYMGKTTSFSFSNEVLDKTISILLATN